jgi:hypothetical protein
VGAYCLAHPSSGWSLVFSVQHLAGSSKPLTRTVGPFGASATTASVGASMKRVPIRECPKFNLELPLKHPNVKSLRVTAPYWAFEMLWSGKVKGAAGLRGVIAMGVGNIFSTQNIVRLARVISRVKRLTLGLIAVTAFSAADSNIQAQGLHHHGGNPQIKEAGRWHVQTLSGDQPAQVATGKPVEFDDVFACVSTACGGVQVFAHDSTICDPFDFENISSGLVINGTTGAFQFGVSGGFGDFFIYTFVGTLSEISTVLSGIPSLVSASITGTYASTPGGCNNGLAEDQGTFIATWYPPMAGTFYGILTPIAVDEPPFGVELVLNQALNGGLTGTASTGRLLRLKDDLVFVPIQSACFNSTTLAITQGLGPGISGASGDLFQVLAVDSAGNSLSLEGVATEIGSNSRYLVQYEILGGVCAGQSMTSTSFLSVTMPKRSDRPMLSPRAASEIAIPLRFTKPVD